MLKKKIELTVKEGAKVFLDKKTKARTLAIPFKFFDGSTAVCMISRLKDEDWKPDFKTITINYEN